MRQAGLLMSIQSMPNQFGIGDFGPKSYEFVDLLKKTGMTIWQILPLNPLGYGNSPYQPYSSKAMDECYISLELLEKEGLIHSVESFRKDEKTIDYEAVRAFKQPYLKEAFSNFKEDEGYKTFVQQSWVYTYAVFLTLKKANGMQCWNDWPEECKQWIHTRDEAVIAEYDEQIRYEMFVQYTLYRQWKKLKDYTNKKGIQILGDVPFYVGIDSEDVWSSQKSFLLDDDGRPTFIAGVPPDYFSETGQRWGNPIYDWTALRDNNFKFWVDRLAYSAELFDIIRIDHFRAFDTYWKIPSSCPTAIDGVWMEAPGYELFDEVFEQYPDMKIVAEDLGDLRPEVITLRDHYNFKGMRVVQFTFDSKFMPEDPENLIIYTGTHDNQTIRGWVAEQPEKEKVKIRKYFKKNNYRYPVLSENFIAYAMDSKAEYAIVPMCDVLNLTAAARLNTPGTVGYPNWAWRMTGFGKFEDKISFLKKCVRNSKR